MRTVSPAATPAWTATIDPRLKVLYLLAVTAMLFAVRRPWLVCVVAGAQLVLAIVAGLSARAAGRLLRKVAGYGVALAIVLACFPDGQDPRWIEAAPGIRLSLGGLAHAALAMLRIAGVALASEVVRLGDPSALAAGLRGLGAPSAFAAALDVTLALLGDSGRGRGTSRGHGGGGGGGRGRHAGEGGEGFGSVMRRLARGDVHALVHRIRQSLQKAEHAVAQRGDLRSAGVSARDVAVIAGIASAMLAFKILKILPGIPFAPGHKTVLLVPLYILAGALTESRFGATLTGATMGTVAFLMGDGRYGALEIAKHIAPGVLVDLLRPIMFGGAHARGVVAWCLFGLVVALGRFATVLLVTMLVGAPAEMYALLTLPALAHLVFGLLSGFVTYHLVRALDDLGAETNVERTS